MFKKIVNVCDTYLTKTSIELLKLDVTLLHCKIISKLNTQIKLQPDHFNEFFSNLVPIEMDILSLTQYFTTHESFWSAVKFVTVTPSTTYCNDMMIVCQTHYMLFVQHRNSISYDSNETADYQAT